MLWRRRLPLLRDVVVAVAMQGRAVRNSALLLVEALLFQSVAVS